MTDIDRFFWEEREGSWLSDIEGSYNIYDEIESIQPLNSAYLVLLLLQFDFHERIMKKHQERLTKWFSPRLLEIPYDMHQEKKAAINKINDGLIKYMHLFHKCGVSYANCFLMDKLKKCAPSRLRFICKR